MLAENMDGELSDFDLKHFCDGTPIYCYYFRLPALQSTQAQLLESEKLLERLPNEIPLSTALEKEISLKARKLLSNDI